MTRKEQIKQMIKEVVAKHLPDKTYKLFIFGSQANKPELQRADIDIGIDSGEKLNLMIREQIHQDLQEMETLYFFDFIDFQAVEEYFKKVALSNIEIL